MTQLFLRKTSFKFKILVTFDQAQRMALTFDTHITSFSHLVEFFKHLETLGCNKLKENNNFHFFPYKSLMWPNLTLA